MQCILTLTKFVEYFETHTFNDKQPISRAFQKFVSLYKSTNNKVVSPAQFISDIQGKIKLFNGSQQDAHSFLEFLLASLFEENKPEKNKRSKIEEMFLVEHLDTIKCKSCFYSVEKRVKSPIQLLSINESISNSLLAYEAIEDFVDEEAQWKCDKCNQHVSTGIKHRITESSEYLIIHLNRFIDLTRKNNNNVFVDRELVLNDLKYKITGVVCHSGSLNFGHYFAYAETCKIDGSKEYVKFNDTITSTANISINSPGPYLLFYRREDDIIHL